MILVQELSLQLILSNLVELAYAQKHKRDDNTY